MKVLILAAGYGTRLYALVKDMPKVLLEINEKPLIDHLLDKLGGLKGLNEIIVVTNAKFYEIFQAWANRKQKKAIPISVINDGTTSPEDRLGSIGDVRFVLKKLNLNEDLLVVGGDNLFDYRLEDYHAFAIGKSPRVTIGLYDIKDKSKASQFGVVGLDSLDKIISFDEKPKAPKSSLIAMCLYYMPKDSIHFIEDYIRETKNTDAAGSYISWLSRQEDVFGFKFEGKWYDIGSVESYKAAQADFKS